MDTKAIIDALGGYRVVAKHFDIHHTKAHRWIRYGIPPLHWPETVRMARASGLPEITIEVLEAVSPLKKREDARRAAKRKKRADGHDLSGSAAV